MGENNFKVVMECQVDNVITSKMKKLTRLGGSRLAQRKKTIEGYIKDLMKLPCNDRTGLLDGLGYTGRKDNAALIAAVIVSKAQSGEMNCLKEIMRVCSQQGSDTGLSVKIIDDIK